MESFGPTLTLETVRWNQMPSTPPSHWIAFHLRLVLLLAVELVFSRLGLLALAPEARRRRQHRNAVMATVMWVAAALGVCRVGVPYDGRALRHAVSRRIHH